MMSGRIPGGPIGWFTHNHVAANLLMAFILVAGGLSVFSIRQEVFPEISMDTISISVPYPGAAPEEVEESICQRIEERVKAIEGVKSITARAVEGIGSVNLELEKGADLSEVMEEVKNEVDRITTFPDEAEEPVVVELKRQTQVINIAIYGDVGERSLKEMAELVRNDLTSLPVISQVALSGVRDYEISIEVSEESLRRHKLSFDQVVNAVERSSLDLPGGSVRTETGEILIRTKGQRYSSPEFADVVVLTRNDGTRVLLGQIARIIDGFDEDTEVVTRFNGRPAALVEVSRVAEQDALAVVDAVKKYIERKSAELPDSVELSVWRDRSEILKGRRDLLIRNGLIGLCLVLLCLTLFLDLRLAFWVTMGIPISFMGAFWLIPMVGVSINMISLFAFIVSLGIVVDDAIVVGENIYAHFERGKPPLQAAIDGTLEMAKPVTFAVATSIVAFMPMLFVEGSMGKFIWVIPSVVISVLAISLVEGLFILPAHLSFLKRGNEGNRINPAERFRRQFGRGLAWFINKPYAWLLERAVEWRYLTLAIFVALLLVCGGYVGGGHIKFLFFPKVESDRVTAKLSMPLGTSINQTSEGALKIEAAARQLQEELNSAGGEKVVTHIFSLIGGHTSGGAHGSTSAASHLAQISMQLLSSEKRKMRSSDVAGRWREIAGEVPGAEELTFSSSLFSTGNAIELRLAGTSMESLLEASERAKEEIAGYPGTYDISDSFRKGKQELKLKLKPQSRSLGITLADLARQVRQGYYGDEVLRLQRGRDDIKVMVRYPAEERKSLGDLERMRIRTQSGVEIPFTEVAEVTLGRGFASINREDRKRVVSVIADVDEKVAVSAEIIDALENDFLPELIADYPGLTYSFEGRERRRRESMSSLGEGFVIALLAIYALLAIPFRSYTQPLIVMSAIPFGILGAMGGHVLLNMPLTLLSMFGIVALSGVVVNDSLIMIDYINNARERGVPMKDAVMASGKQRFRPILLTTMTTFCGLLPMILEKSVQAQFLIPMAVSLAFGVLAATTITLVMIPASYAVLEDYLNIIGWTTRRYRVEHPGETGGANEGDGRYD